RHLCSGPTTCISFRSRARPPRGLAEPTSLLVPALPGQRTPIFTRVARAAAVLLPWRRAPCRHDKPATPATRVFARSSVGGMAKGGMTSTTGLSAIVLAAGKGTRMKSQLPKVLHPLCGRPLLEYAVTAAFEAGADQVVVVTSGQPEITRALSERYGEQRITVVVQDPPRGTGDAVRVGLSAVKHARSLILYGDTPLLRAQDLSGLLAALDVP